MISEVNSAGAFPGELGVDGAVRILRLQLIFSRLFLDVVGTTGLRIEDSFRFLCHNMPFPKGIKSTFPVCDISISYPYCSVGG